MKTNKIISNTSLSNITNCNSILKSASSVLSDPELTHIQNMLLFNIDQLTILPKNTLCLSNDKDFLIGINGILESCISNINCFYEEFSREEKTDME